MSYLRNLWVGEGGSVWWCPTHIDYMSNMVVVL